MIVTFIKTSSVTLDHFNGSEPTCHGFCSLFQYALGLFKAVIGMECLKKISISIESVEGRNPSTLKVYKRDPN